MPVSASNALLQAATDLVTERGPAGFTLREAARRAGVSHATPGYLFGDLRGLLTRVALEGTRRFTDAMQEAYDRPGTALERLAAVGNAYVEFARREPNVFRLVIGDEYVDGSDPELSAARHASEGPLRRAMAEILGTDEETPEVLTRLRLAWSTVHGVARLILDGPFRGAEESETELAAAVIAALGPALVAPIA